jgi:hypothetical protein
VTGRQGKSGKQLLYDLKETERGSTISNCVDRSLWKRLWTFRQVDYEMNESPRT